MKFREDKRENTFLFPCRALECLVLAWRDHSWHADYKEFSGALGRVMRVVQDMEGLPLLLLTVRGGSGLGC